MILTMVTINNNDNGNDLIMIMKGNGNSISRLYLLQGALPTTNARSATAGTSRGRPGKFDARQHVGFGS